MVFIKISKDKAKEENMYKHKEKYILDFTYAKTRIDIHDIIEKEFDFPDYYGANWDAFWDCITDFVDSRGLDLEIVGLDKIYSKFKQDIDTFIETLKDLKHAYNDKYIDVIKIVIHHGRSKIELN